MKGELAEKVTGLVFNCTQVGLSLAGLSAAAAATGTLGAGAILGGVMLRNHMLNPDRLADKRINKIRNAALKSYEFNQTRSPAEKEAIDKCQTVFVETLSALKITPNDLVAEIRKRPHDEFPIGATNYVMERLAVEEACFANGIQEEFARHVISSCFQAAIEDRDYYASLDPHVQIEQLKALGRLEEKIDEILRQMDEKFKLSPRNQIRVRDVLSDMDIEEWTVDDVVAELVLRLNAYAKAEAIVAQPSNLGDDFERLAKTVRDLLEQDNAKGALNEIERDLLAHDEEDARRAAEKDKKVDLAIQTAVAAGQPEKVAEYEVARLGTPDEDWYKKVFLCKDPYYQDGLVNGVRLSLQISVAVCRLAAKMAPTKPIRAAIQNSQANAFFTLGERGDEAALSQAVTAYEAALEVCTREASPMGWAMMQNNLGNALKTLGERGDDAALSQAVTAFEAALDVLTRQASPMHWAGTQNNLGTALKTLGERGDDAALSQAVTAFEATLEVYTRDVSPMDWAMTQNNLGNALKTLGERGDDAALSKAVTAFEAALEVRTREASPMHWAGTQNNLGNAFLTLGERGDKVALSQAVTAYEAALEIYTREASPMDWAGTQNNLGNAFFTLGERGDDAALSQAVSAYEAALEVYTREAAPMQWAMARENIGNLYIWRARHGETGMIQNAITAYEDALSVYSEEHQPYDHVTASHSLAEAVALRNSLSD